MSICRSAAPKFGRWLESQIWVPPPSAGGLPVPPPATTRAVPGTTPAAHYPSTRRSKLGPSSFQFHVLLTSYETLRDDLPLLGNGCLIASDDETLLDDLPLLGNGCLIASDDS